MTRSAIEAGPRAKRWSPAAKILVGVLIAVVAIVLLPVVLNAVHFSTAPKFDTYLLEHPVSAESLVRRLPQANELTETRDWRVGEVDVFGVSVAEEDERSLWIAEQSMVVHRGDEILANARVEVLATSPDERDRDGFGIRVLELASADRLRAVVVVSLSEPESVVGPESAGKGTVLVDLIVAAGEGEDRALIVGGDGLPPLSSDDASVNFLALFGRMLWPLRSLPDEGWVLHLRDGVSMTAARVEGGSHGFSVHSSRFEISTEEYSYAYELETRTERNGNPDMSSTSTRSNERTWNGTLW